VTTFDREASGRRLRLSPTTSALLVIDVQDKLVHAMDRGTIEGVIKNIRILIDAARHLGIPIFVSQQYPKGLGNTVEPIEKALALVDQKQNPVRRWDKVEFSAVAAEGFTKLGVAGDNGFAQWMVCGLEAHVCVYQTVRDITGWGSTVHLASDAIASRTKANWRCGISLSRDAGALITSTETIVFDLLGKAGTPPFKALSQAIK